jgi:hypothetical protein
MRAGYLSLFSLACCPLAGWPLLAHASFSRLSFFARAGLSCAAGAVVLSGWMTVFALLGIAWRPVVLVLMAVLVSYLLRFLLPSSEAAREKVPPRESRTSLAEKLALVVIGVSVLAALAAAASASATSPDLLLFWGPKAQAFAAARTVDAAFLRDPFLGYMHTSYPPLVTNLYAFASIVAGRFAWGAATLAFPLAVGVLALALPGVLRRAVPRRIAWASSALVVSAFGFLGNELDVGGNGDSWLWLFETLAMATLVGDFAARRAGQLLAGLLLAGAVTAKVEGLPFALVAAALFLLLRGKDLKPGPAAAFLFLPSAVSLGAWLAFGATRRIFYGYEQYGRFLDVHGDRLPTVFSEIGGTLWSAGWALPYLLPLAALISAPRKSRLVLLPLAVSAVLAAFFVFTYLHGDANPGTWIEWSAGRVFSPITALLVLASVCRRTAQS